MTALDKHPEKNLIRLQLSQNSVLKSLDLASMAELEASLRDFGSQKIGDFAAPRRSPDGAVFCARWHFEANCF